MVRTEDLKYGIWMESGYFSSTTIFGSTSTTPLSTSLSHSLAHTLILYSCRIMYWPTHVWSAQYKHSVWEESGKSAHPSHCMGWLDDKPVLLVC